MQINMTVVQSKGPRLGMRHVQALLIFLYITVIFISRLNVSISVVAMTNAEKTNPNFQEFDWNEQQKSLIISSFYWSHVLSNFPAGFLCRRFGAKIIMFLSTFCSAFFSVMIPLCVPWGGWQIYCAIRIIQGLLQGVMFPCLFDHLSKWSPSEERNRLLGFGMTGSECGTVLSMILPGIIAASPLGWPGISYISGALCFAWCALWLVFASNTPKESKFISAAELTYIETTVQRTEDDDDPKRNQIPVPWRALLTSAPFLAMIVMRCAQNWGFFTLQAELPSYLNGVLDMDITNNARFSALPFLAMWCMSYVYLAIADLIMKKKLLSLTALRKIYSTISAWVPAVALIGMGFIESKQKTLAIVLITATIAINASTNIGVQLNAMDLSPVHTGTIVSISTSIASITQLLSPLVVGLIVVDESDRTQWQIVFIIAAVFFFVGNLVYIIWGTAVTQPWNAADFLHPKDIESSIKNDVLPTTIPPTYDDTLRDKANEQPN